tara:strand:- start:814 stop:1413 length:600 start_codon:yes stop_codon:yes gene_type:complete
MNQNIKYLFIKRKLDILISLLLTILLFPIIILSALILIIDLKENPIFLQKRPGYKEKIFTLIKLKTLRSHKGEISLSDNQRITKISSIIRKLRIDELPQLINIIKGDMSFIGPRPLLVEYLPFYSSKQRLRHNVRPGITGLAQINGSERLEFDKRIDFDLKYIENLSFKIDILIIFKTFYYVIGDFYNVVDHNLLPKFK